jgi:hypothetical protein
MSLFVIINLFIYKKGGWPGEWPGGRAGWVEFLAGSSKQMEIKYLYVTVGPKC